MVNNKVWRTVGYPTICAYAMQGFADALFVPLAATIFLDYGIKSEATGIILAASQLSSLVLTAPLSMLADVFRCHKKAYVASRLLYSLSAGAMPLLLWQFVDGRLAHVSKTVWYVCLLVVMAVQGTLKSQAMTLQDANVLELLEPVGLRTYYGRVRLWTSLGRATGAFCGGPIYAELGGQLLGGQLAALAWFVGSVILAAIAPLQRFSFRFEEPAEKDEEQREPLLRVESAQSDDDGGGGGGGGVGVGDVGNGDEGQEGQNQPNADMQEDDVPEQQLDVSMDDGDEASVPLTNLAGDYRSERRREKKKSPLVALLCSPRLAFLFVIAAVNGIAGATFDYYVVAYARKSLGADGWVCALITTASTVGNVPGFFFAPVVLRNLGPRTMVAASMSLAILRCVSYALLRPSTVNWVIPISLLHGIQFSFFWTGGMELAAKCAGKRTGVAGTVQALFQGAYFGVGATAGLALGGYLYEEYSPIVMFEVKVVVLVFALALLLVGELIVWLLRRRRHQRRRNAAAGTGVPDVVAASASSSSLHSDADSEDTDTNDPSSAETAEETRARVMSDALP